jgi:hypothetical protein
MTVFIGVSEALTQKQTEEGQHYGGPTRHCIYLY